MIDNRQISRMNSPLFTKILLVLVVFIIFIVSIFSVQQTAFLPTGISKALNFDAFFPRLPVSKQGEAKEAPAKCQNSTIDSPEHSDPSKSWLEERNLEKNSSQGSSSDHAKLEEKVTSGARNSSLNFHSRVLSFLDNDCEAKFFMTWISPVKSFRPREISVVKSVFRAHPRGCLIVLSSAMDSRKGHLRFKQFLDRKLKILAVAPNLPFLLEDIAVAKSWLEDINSGKKSPGKIPLGQNLSNLMRLAVLYKYGGVYIDTDFIVFKSFNGLRNAIGEQVVGADAKRWPRLNNAVLIFDRNHSLLREFIEDFAKGFNGNIWGHNGPALLTRVTERLQGGPAGNNFTILPLKAFYSVHWGRIGELFKGPRFENETKLIEEKVDNLRRESYGLHMWNSFSKKYPIEEGSVIQRLLSD